MTTPPEVNGSGRHCRLCQSALDGVALDLGALPPCNRFTARRDALPVHAFAVTCCGSCGLVQLLDPPPIDMVRPRVPWIRYNEPDAHLDDLAERLLATCGRRNPSVSGVGPFEAPLLDRLARRGARTHVLEAIEPFSGPAQGYPYLETWQARIDATTMAALAHRAGTADIVTCRYLIEHCHEALNALAALSRLLAPDGIVAIEVPDSSKFLAACDYCFLWEEHVSYFVEHTLAAIAEAAGYETISLLRYPGALEDALVAVLRRARQSVRRGAGRAKGVPESAAQFSSFCAAFPRRRSAIAERIRALAGPSLDGVALFGIGHQAIMFVNALRLGQFVANAVDDDACKRGLFPPGFEVAITSSAELLEKPHLRACLLAVSPRVETKVAEKLAPLLARGAQLHSIYAGRPGSIVPG